MAATITKIALAVWNNRISPVFDSSGDLLIIETENGKENTRRHVTLKTTTPAARADELSDMGVQRLICGAISQPFASAIESKGIYIIPFVAGDVNSIIHSILEGTILNSDFYMPGCGNRRRRRFRGGRNSVN